MLSGSGDIGVFAICWHRFNMVTTLTPSIHPTSTAYLESGRVGNSSNRDPLCSISWATTSSFPFKGIPRRSSASMEMYFLHLVFGLPGGLLQVASALRTFLRRHSGGIRTRCPNHLCWLLSKRSSSGSTPSLSQVTELLTLSLREMPATRLRKLIAAACIRDLILSVMTHTVLHDHRWE